MMHFLFFFVRPTPNSLRERLKKLQFYASYFYMYKYFLNKFLKQEKPKMDDYEGEKNFGSEGKILIN